MSSLHLRPVASRGRGPVSTASFPRDWWSFAGAMGGATAAAILDAAGNSLPPGWQPRTANFQFLASVRDSPLDIEVTVVREGRASMALSAVASTEGRPALSATVLGSPLDDELGIYTDSAVPLVPPPEDCEVVELPRDLVPVAEHLEFRFAGEARPTAGGDAAELVAWVALRSEGAYGAGELAVISDAMPPGLFGVASAPVLMPTADLSLVFSQHPQVTGFVLVRMRTRHLDRAWVVDDCDVWSRAGSLLVQSRQSRRLLAPLSA